MQYSCSGTSSTTGRKAGQEQKPACHVWVCGASLVWVMGLLEEELQRIPEGEAVGPPDSIPKLNTNLLRGVLTSYLHYSFSQSLPSTPPRVTTSDPVSHLLHIRNLHTVTVIVSCCCLHATWPWVGASEEHGLCLLSFLSSGAHFPVLFFTSYSNWVNSGQAQKGTC